MNALREWLEAVRPPASRSRLADALMGRRDPLATPDPVENARMALPAEPNRYGAALTNRTPDAVDGVRPMFGLPQQAPVVTPDQERRTRMMVDALSGASSSIRAFHGSPHRFDRFSMARIGTGEGAQAYGHGLYFAGNEDVARSYRDVLSPGSSGHMYEVRLNTEPTRLLDWDAPLAAQPEIMNRLASSRRKQVQELLSADMFQNLAAPRSSYGVDIGQVSGADLHRALSYELSGRPISPKSSQALRSVGIDGIQYLDEGSRSAGQGSRNYVMFNDAQIEILRRYGLLGPAVGAAAATQGGEEQ